MKSDIIQFHNCFILRDGQIIKEDLWTCEGKIVDPEPIFFDKKDYADIKIDCQGLLIAPGYIDLQVNGSNILSWFRVKVWVLMFCFVSIGGFGVDFSRDSETIDQGLEVVAKGLLVYGTTSFCPTLVTSSPEFYHQAILSHTQYTKWKV